MSSSARKVQLLRNPSDVSNFYSKDLDSKASVVNASSIPSLNEFSKPAFVKAQLQRTFQFQERIKPLDVSKFNNIDIDYIIKTKNIRELLNLLDELAFSSLEKRQLRGYTYFL